MDPREFLTFAESLVTTDRSEAAIRSTISRAYYGAWHAIRLHLSGTGAEISPRDNRGKFLGPHDRVIHALSKSQTEGASKIAAEVYNLKDLRTRADYELEDTDVLRHINRALQLAERVVAWAESQQTDPV